MEAKNFRIGNFISDTNASDSFFAKVKKLDLSRCYYGQFHSAYTDIKPIKITEDWLNKFGFERTPFGRKFNDFYLEASSRVVKTDELYGFKYEHVPEEKYINLDYVHQLQNLFFALTGKELELKDEHSTCG